MINKKIFNIFILVVGIFLNCKSQSIIWNDIQTDSISKIDYTNDSIINPLFYPDFNKNGLFLNVTSTDFFDFQKEDHIKKITQDYIDKNGITDNRSQSKRFAIIKKGDEFLLNAFQTETRYYYDEGCGIIRNIAIVNENVIEENVFCIFNENPQITPTRFQTITIEDYQNTYIPPNKKIHFTDQLDSLAIIYKGTYCYESFEYKGLGTISPIFINVSLRIIDLENQNEEKIIEIPYNHGFNINKILLADINSDKHHDLIIETEDELCIYRMIYLSKRENGLTKYKYIGRMEIYCDCP